MAVILRHFAKVRIFILFFCAAFDIVYAIEIGTIQRPHQKAKETPIMHIKKLLSILLCTALLLCFAGCKDKEEASAPTQAPVASTPETAGVLFLSVGTEFRVIYDTDGLVVAVESTNDTAAELLSSNDDAIGTACDLVVSDLIERSIAAGKHPQTRVVVIKQAPDSASPSAAFLENVRIDAAAVTDYEVVLILADTLTQEGYITADQAKDILTRQCKLTDVNIRCSDVEDGFYTLTFEIDGAEQEYKINAVTGTVVLESLPSDFAIPEIEDNDPLDMQPMDTEPMDQFSSPEYDGYQDSPFEGMD